LISLMSGHYNHKNDLTFFLMNIFSIQKLIVIMVLAQKVHLWLLPFTIYRRVESSLLTSNHGTFAGFNYK